jgi:hypothetical protein
MDVNVYPVRTRPDGAQAQGVSTNLLVPATGEQLDRLAWVWDQKVQVTVQA